VSRRGRKRKLDPTASRLEFLAAAASAAVDEDTAALEAKAAHRRKIQRERQARHRERKKAARAEQIAALEAERVRLEDERKEDEAQREEERRRELLNMGYVISSTGNPVKPQSHARQLQRKRAKVRPILVAKLKAALAEVAEDWDVDALRDALSYVQKEEVMRDLATARSALVLQAVEPPLQPDAEESQDAGEAVPVFAVPL